MKVQSSAPQTYHSISALANSPALAILVLVRTWSTLKFPAMLSKGLRFDACGLLFSLKGEQFCMMKKQRNPFTCFIQSREQKVL